MSGRHARLSPWRWLITFPPAAGLIASIALLASPAAAFAAPVHLANQSGVEMQAMAGLEARPDTSAILVKVLARREAAKDVRQEARQDERQAARAAAQAAALAAARQARKSRTSAAPAQVPSTSVPTQGIFSYSQLEALWVSAGGPSWAEAQAAQIAECESGGDPDAYNPSGATGLWQILGQVADFGQSLTIPSVNADNAVAKFHASGDTFAQWVCQ